MLPEKTKRGGNGILDAAKAASSAEPMGPRGEMMGCRAV